MVRFLFSEPTTNRRLDLLSRLSKAGLTRKGVWRHRLRHRWNQPTVEIPESEYLVGHGGKELGNNFAASVGYSGSHSYDIVDNGNANGWSAMVSTLTISSGDLIHHQTTFRPG